MIYRADEITQKTLLLYPETGMTYQFIEAKNRNSNITEKYIAYNSEIIIDFNKTFKTYRDTLFRRSYEDIALNAAELNLSPHSIEVYSKRELLNSSYLTGIADLKLSSGKINKYERHPSVKEAKDSPKEYANGEDVFVRLSAFKNDKRIDFIRNKLLYEAYTTTMADYFNCLIYKDDPIDRYALPNNNPIKYAFHVKPKKHDILQKGIVAPNFGKEGGGIEVYFEQGTSDNTLIKIENFKPLG